MLKHSLCCRSSTVPSGDRLSEPLNCTIFESWLRLASVSSLISVVIRLNDCQLLYLGGGRTIKHPGHYEYESFGPLGCTIFPIIMHTFHGEHLRDWVTGRV